MKRGDYDAVYGRKRDRKGRWIVSDTPSRPRLSPREQEIILTLVERPDLTNADLAKRFVVELTTIKWLLASARRKTGTSNVTQLILWALREANRAQRLERWAALAYKAAGNED